MTTPVDTIGPYELRRTIGHQHVWFFIDTRTGNLVMDGPKLRTFPTRAEAEEWARAQTKAEGG